MPDVLSRRVPRVIGGVSALLFVGALLAACAPEPGPGATPSTSATPSLSIRPGDPSATPIETRLPDAGFEVPGTCEEIYSASMLARLEATVPPLNDPGLTMLSTENTDLLEILDAGAPTLRCTWGAPGEVGIATAVTAVDGETASTIVDTLAGAGSECEALGDGTVCRIEQKGLTLDDQEYTKGETHYVGGGGWASTAWINVDTSGYTEDIVATLWG